MGDFILYCIYIVLLYCADSLSNRAIHNTRWCTFDRVSWPDNFSSLTLSIFGKIENSYCCADQDFLEHVAKIVGTENEKLANFIISNMALNDPNTKPLLREHTSTGICLICTAG